MSYGWGIQCKTWRHLVYRIQPSWRNIKANVRYWYVYDVLRRANRIIWKAKQYRLKRKLLLQHQASTSSETEILQKQKKAEYAKQYRLKRKLLMQKQDSTSTETHPPPSKRRYDGASKTWRHIAVRHIHVKRRASLREAWYFLLLLLLLLLLPSGHAVGQLVEALCYNSEGCGFDSRWCHSNFSLI
jgi:hypothetical protein